MSDETRAETGMSEKGRFYYIGEMSRMTGVPSHVLRYWEKEFPSLKPARDQKGLRLYTASDAEQIKRIKSLVYGEGYRIRGAKRKLREKTRPADTASVREEARMLKEILRDLREAKQCLP